MIARLTSRDRRGAVAVELALILPTFLLAFMGLIEFGLHMATQSSLDFAAREASRVGITGSPPPSGMTRAQQIEAVARQSVASFMDPLKVTLSILSYNGYQSVGQPEPFTDANGNKKWDPGEIYVDVNGNGRWDADQGASGPGGSAQISLYLLTYAGSSFTGFFAAATYQSRIIVHNEPYAQ